MDKLKTGAFTGDPSKGNPYEGDRGTGIQYDSYEANNLLVDTPNGNPQIVPTYRLLTRRLIGYLQAKEGQRVLDLGSGTGISTLEALTQNPGILVTGVEKSQGMLEVAKYKFHKTDGRELLAFVKDTKLLEYWRKFRDESARFEHYVQFINGDIQDMGFLGDWKADHAIGNQIMHWTDLTRAFTSLRRVLKDKGTLVWNTASHFYDDEEFPSAEYGFRYNDFLKYVLDELASKSGTEVGDYHNLSVPKHNLETIRDTTKKAGFDTKKVGLHLNPLDFQTFIQKHVPQFARQLVKSKWSEEELTARIDEAIAKTINNPAAFQDTRHKYDIIPIFRSIKL